jgi:lysophospholipase L1-like esterase
MRRIPIVVGLAVASVLPLATAACSRPARQPDLPPGPLYYVSLGDSLAQGVQPDAVGLSAPTDVGYPDQIFSALRAHRRDWRLIKLGCSGETTRTMIHGGKCQYPAGSQLAQAERVLRAHRLHLGLITIDIGANDPNSCITGPVSIGRIAACVGRSLQQTLADLRVIMRALRAAAGPQVKIVAMTYYVPELAGWLDGRTGQELAVLTERLVAGYNRMLAVVYRRYGSQVANVFGAFHSSDFAQQVRVAGHGMVPRNVAAICQWTWSCASPPRGPNEHANGAGYRIIAQAFLHADPALTG